MFAGDTRGNRGCGATALALLTGVPPDTIAKRNRKRNRHLPHYDDAFIVRFLRQGGFTVLPVTQCALSAGYSLIDESHVLLLSQLLFRGANEATWRVTVNGMYYHNFEPPCESDEMARG